MMMKKLATYTVIISSLICLLAITSCDKNKDLTGNTPGDPTTPDTTLTIIARVGFASQNGGTTGGDGGQVVTANTYDELKIYLENTTTRYIVKVNQRIYNGPKGGSIRVRDNKTLMGEGANAFLDGIGLTINSNRNVIIRNIKFTFNSITNRDDPAVYSPTGDEGRPQILVNGGDLISLRDATNVWIDHCEFYNENPQLQTNQDLYDGCVDIVSNSAFITLSYNLFRDAHKVSLVGNADTDNFDRRVTYHHNHFKNVRQRIPSFRHGTAHFVNNYVEDITSTGINSRMGACVKVENNVFENVRSPLIVDGTPRGQYELINNSFSGVQGIAPPAVSNCTANIPYTFTADPVAQVKQKVLAEAGVGKLQ